MSASEREKLQAEEQRVIEMRIDKQNRDDRAYMERLQSAGIVAPNADGITSALPGGPSSSGSLPIPRVNTNTTSRGSSLAASPPNRSPQMSPTASLSNSLLSSPRLAPPIGESLSGDDEQHRQWLQALEQQQEMSERGQAAASPTNMGTGMDAEMERRASSICANSSRLITITMVRACRTTTGRRNWRS